MAEPITLFLCGDVMTGRGIDQILPHPGPPELFEPRVRSAIDYVAMAEQANGPIIRPVRYDYIWGAALDELQHVKPDARIINLECAITTSDEPWTGKSILYRMHPENLPCLNAAHIDCCVLANNHVLDWGYAGLQQTLQALEENGIRTAGAGRNASEAAAPAVIPLAAQRRVVVFGFCETDSGVPRDWAAGGRRPGVNLLQRYLSPNTIDDIARQVQAVKVPGDIVVASIHWGGNWGFAIPAEQRAFAQRLVDVAGVDIVHGHSSHNLKGIEVYRDKLILYGSGDFLDDCEGVRGPEQYRAELAMMYFPTVDPASGRLQRLTMKPARKRQMRVDTVNEDDRNWLLAMLNREGQKLGTRVREEPDGHFSLLWQQ